MTGPAWSSADLHVALLSEHRPNFGVVVAVQSGRGGRAVLPPELTRSLAHWLLWAVGDRPHPSDPDAVRQAVDDARHALRAQSTAAESEDFRAGLAWVSRSLDQIAAVADAAPRPERTTR